MAVSRQNLVTHNSTHLTAFYEQQLYLNKMSYHKLDEVPAVTHWVVMAGVQC